MPSNLHESQLLHTILLQRYEFSPKQPTIFCFFVLQHKETLHGPHQTPNSFFTATSSLPKIWENPCDSTFSTYATPNIIRYIIGIFSGNMKFILSVNSAYCTRYISNVREEMKYTTFPHNALSNTLVIFSQLQNIKKK